MGLFSESVARRRRPRLAGRTRVLRSSTAPDIAVGEPAAERTDPNYRDVLLEGRLKGALARLNPGLPPEALEDAYRKITRIDAPSLLERNRAVYRLMVDGITVEYRRKDGSIAGGQAR
jgi:type I restriction enzyme R subunit